MSNQDLTPRNDEIAIVLGNEITNATDSPRARALKKFGLVAISAIPWVGGFLAAALELRENPGRIDELQRQWLEHHSAKLHKIYEALNGIANRLQNFGDEIDQRLESPEFLKLVDKGFRIWDESSTEEKRDFVRKLLTNAAAVELCSDDLIRLFLDWIRKYDETHFRVIEAIYSHPGISRKNIWLSIHPNIPRDDSSEADLFKLLIHDLSLGHVIRQKRDTNFDGAFLKKAATRSVKSNTMKSPFDANDHYELTELGAKFVHYVMRELAPQIGQAASSAKQNY